MKQKGLLLLLMSAVLAMFVSFVPVKAYYLEPDKTFGQNGVLDIRDPSDKYTSSYGRQIYQSDGKIFLCGNKQKAAGGSRLHLRRLNNDGTTDNTFNNFDEDEPLYSNLGGGGTNNYCDGVVQDGDQYVVSAYGTDLNPNYTSFAIFRVNHDGSLDKSFNHTGHNNLRIEGQTVYPYTVFVDGDNYVVFGQASATGMYIARFLHTGEFDTSFNEVGYRYYSEISNRYSLDVTKDSDGNYVALTPSGSTVFYMRISPNGNILSSTDLGNTATYFSTTSYDTSLSPQMKEDLTYFRFGNNGTTVYIQSAKFNKNGTFDEKYGTKQHDVVLKYPFLRAPSGFSSYGGCRDEKGRMLITNYAYHASGLLSTQIGTSLYHNFYAILDSQFDLATYKPSLIYQLDFPGYTINTVAYYCHYSHEKVDIRTSNANFYRFNVLYQIMLPTGYHAYTGDSDITYGTGKGIKGDREVVVKKENSLVLQFTQNIDNDIYLAQLKTETNNSKDTIWIKNASGVKNYEIYLKKSAAGRRVYLCPDAEKLNDVKNNCKKMSSISVRKLKQVRVDGEDYWLVPVSGDAGIFGDGLPPSVFDFAIDGVIVAEVFVAALIVFGLSTVIKSAGKRVAFRR